MTNRGARKRTVLLVEDEPLLRRVFTETLEDSGFGVEAASSGDAAWRLIESGGPFDILVTDVRMPGSLDGIDLARKVKAADESTSVIVMSGFVGQASIDAGLGTFLAKPFSAHRLLWAIEEAAAR